MPPPKLVRFSLLLPVIVVSLFWGTWMLVGLTIAFIISPRKFLSSNSITSIPACARDKSLGEHGFLSLPGEPKIRLHYVAAGREGKPLMLLLHGFPECWYSWRYQLKEFSRDYRVVAVDLRGYGESDKPSGIASYTLDLLTADVAGIVSSLGYKKCILIGHDWGGVITWCVGARYPDLCEKIVILNAPHLETFQKHMRCSFKQFMASWYTFFFQVPCLPEVLMGCDDYKMLQNSLLGKRMGLRNKQNVAQEDIDLLKFYYSSYENRTAPINYYRANMRYESCIPKVKVEPPLLVVWGTGDAALTVDLAAKSLEYAKNGELKMVDGASHWVQQDEPQLVNGHIRTFLQK